MDNAYEVVANFVVVIDDDNDDNEDQMMYKQQVVETKECKSPCPWQ